MATLAAGEPRGDENQDDRQAAPESPAVAGEAARMVARARWLLIVSGFTTMIAIVAVIAVIGYRIFHAGGTGAGVPAEATIALPKGARVIATAVAADRIVVTLDVGGVSEIRTFDVKTLKETGRIRFATEP